MDVFNVFFNVPGVITMSRSKFVVSWVVLPIICRHLVSMKLFQMKKYQKALHVNDRMCLYMVLNLTKGSINHTSVQENCSALIKIRAVMLSVTSFNSQA